MKQKEKKLNKMIEIEGASVEEAVRLGLEELQTTIENVEIEILDEPKSGFLKFGTKKAKVRLICTNEFEKEDIPEKYISDKITHEDNETENPEEEKEILDKFITLTDLMGFSVNPKIASLNSKYRIIIKETDDANLLIGKNGKTIEALQIVLNKMLKKSHINKQVFIDIKGYVIQKQKNKSSRHWKKDRPSSHK